VSTTLAQAAIEQIIGSIEMPENCFLQLHTGPPAGTPAIKITDGCGYSRSYPAPAIDWGDVSLSVIADECMTIGVMELRSGHQRMRVALDEQDILHRIDSALEGWEHDAMRWAPDR